MKIGLDVRMINHSGIGTTIRGLLNHTPDDKISHFVLFGPENHSLMGKVRYVKINFPVYSLRQHWAYGACLNKQKLDLFHMPHYDVPLSFNGNLVVTVHDLIHYLFPRYSTKPLSKLYSAVMLRHVSSAARKIIVVSENTRKDLETHFPKARGKIEVVYPGVDEKFKRIGTDQLNSVLSRFGINPGYFLYVGNMRPSKNTLNLVKGYALLRKKMSDAPPLVLAGTDFFKGVNWTEIHSDIRFIGPVKTEELPALYSAASLFVFPSLYEGFGLPPLESMACGTPVLVSKVASLPEVCGAAAEYLDEPSAGHLSEKMGYLINSDERRRNLSKKGSERAASFTWERFAEKTWNVYKSVLDATP